MNVFPDQLPELLLVGRKGNTTMDIQLEGRPYFRQTALARDLQDTPDQHQRPGRNARDRGNILVDGIHRQPLYLVFPFVQQGDAQLRRSDPMGPDRRIMQENSAEIPIMNIGIQVHRIDRMTAADHQAFPC